MEKKALHDTTRKKRIFKYIEEVGNISKRCRHFGISRETYYEWKRRYAKEGDQGLISGKPCPLNLKLRTLLYIEEKIVYL